MWRFSILTFVFGALACAQDVRITWIGQACFVVQNAEGKPVVVTDPPSAGMGYTLPTVEAGAVTVTHDHGDHNNTAGVRGNPTVVDGRGATAERQVEAAGLRFTIIPGFHDNSSGSQRGANSIIRWSQAGISFAHFGDFGEDRLSDSQLAALRGTEVLFIPAGGFYTIDAGRAAAIIAELKPRVSILMHYRTALGGPARLADLAGIEGSFPGLVKKPGAVALSRGSLPAKSEVWALEPAGR